MKDPPYGEGPAITALRAQRAALRESDLVERKRPTSSKEPNTPSPVSAAIIPSCFIHDDPPCGEDPAITALRAQRAALREIAMREMRKTWLIETMRLIAAEEADDYDRSGP